MESGAQMNMIELGRHDLQLPIAGTVLHNEARVTGAHHYYRLRIDEQKADRSFRVTRGTSDPVHFH